ncbi:MULTISPECIES: hypothetical protein [Oceanobacillus]|uniref:hypothetical protein n=1 Tax=Oceanobacillus TaxID=182709 RepID=UPI00034AB7ED|nr:MULTISPECIES: hypothetical protein [Oceanobacillus]MBT2601022.1 hypothetical protein [Oceanobacillus sp. ISL-74]MBT2653527.1 hypothetical protein [Oceanobacillus sp. ISL-73]OEH53302.1 hypothetical protein AQ616_16485 [Oceanobacillus sp. E9]
MELTIIILLILIVLYLTIQLMKTRSKLKSIESNTQIVNKKENFHHTDHPIHQQLLLLIDQQQDVKAVKLARETFGFSLLEGKRYVDWLKRKESSRNIK